jgi:tripartite-type tricarboxylate transporter receptor subunit TctC
MLKFIAPAVAGMAALAAASASAQGVEEFYKGKTVSIVVYTTSGSGYDLAARLLTRHMPHQLPGAPTMIVRNMPGAGGLTATRYLYVTAPKDGTVFGTIGRGIPFEPLLGGASTVDFDPLKFIWMGSPSRESSLAISWHTSQVKTAQDLLTKELIVAGTGASADSEIVPKTLNGLLGTKFKIISGYEGINRAVLSVERGEIEGLAYWSWGAVKTVKPDWVKDKKINILFQTAFVPHPEIPDVPSVLTLAKTEQQTQALKLLFARDIAARPFLMPPDVPKDRADALKRAFEATHKDKEFLAEAEKAQLEIEFVPASEVEEIIHRAYDTPTAVVEMVKKAMGRE